MWFIGQFENGSWGFQQEGCPKRYTSKHETECIKEMYEALKLVVERIDGFNYPVAFEYPFMRVREALAKAEASQETVAINQVA